VSLFTLCPHSFIDGNKRVAFVLINIFLQKNGWEITASEEEAYSMVMELAFGKMSKPYLARGSESNPPDSRANLLVQGHCLKNSRNKICSLSKTHRRKPELNMGPRNY
jgi:hypothetical protein